ncbi:hypothetical protein [Thermoleptolyngbya sp.]
MSFPQGFTVALGLEEFSGEFADGRSPLQKYGVLMKFCNKKQPQTLIAP